MQGESEVTWLDPRVPEDREISCDMGRAYKLEVGRVGMVESLGIGGGTGKGSQTRLGH